MQTGYISFCNGQALNIKSTDVKTHVLNTLDVNYGVKIINKHHDLYSKDTSTSKFRKVPYLMSTKTNGNPYFLYCTRVNFTNTVIMIDKKIQQGYFHPRMIIVRLKFSEESIFDNTLIDGEMIRDNNNEWIFLVSDIIVSKNKSLKEEIFFKRLKQLHSMFEHEFKPHFQDIFFIQIKRYFEFKEAKFLFGNFIPSLNYSCRGIYFKALYCKFKDILYNFDDNLVKINTKDSFKDKSHFLEKKDFYESQSMEIKNDHCNEIIVDVQESNDVVFGLDNDNKKTFQIRKTDKPDVYELFDEEGIQSGNACIQNVQTSKFLHKNFKNSSLTTKLMFLCEKTTNINFTNIWIPIQRIDNSFI